MTQNAFPKICRLARQAAFVICLGIAPGCSSGPELKNYSRSDIDRPFTLPSGIASWSTTGSYSVEKYRFSTGELTTDHTLIPVIPLTWRQSLSDRWNLLWAPIPVATFYQTQFDDSVTSGIILGYGLRISNSGYSSASLVTSYFHRQKLSPDFAIEFQPSIQPWFPLGDRARFDIQSSLGFGPLWQIAEHLSVRAGARAVIRRDSQNVSRGSVYDSSGLGITGDYQWRVILPVYASANWSFARQWDLGSAIDYQKIGETDQYQNLQISYEIKHYW